MKRHALVQLTILAASMALATCGSESPTAPSNTVAFQGVWQGTWQRTSCTETGGAVGVACAQTPTSGALRLTLTQAGTAVQGSVEVASFFIPAVSLMLHPEMADVIRKAGHHEFAVHGWIHEMNTQVPADVERDLVRRALEYLTRVTGTKPVGYRAPSWNFSPATLSIIRELGFTYESSMMSDDRPYELMQDGKPTGIVEIPVEWILDDAPLFNVQGANYASPREVAQVWIDEYDKAWEERTMFVLTMHPHVSGHRSRIVALELLIDHIKKKGGAWFATHKQAVDYVKQQANMK